MKATWRSGEGGSRWNPEDVPSIAVMRRKITFLLLLLLALAVFLFRPVCVPLSEEDLGSVLDSLTAGESAAEYWRSPSV